MPIRLYSVTKKVILVARKSVTALGQCRKFHPFSRQQQDDEACLDKVARARSTSLHVGIRQ